MSVDIEDYVAKCVTCACHKGSPSGRAPILEYPSPIFLWEVVSIDLLQLPPSIQGSRYVLVMVDAFSRFVITPRKDKIAQSVKHALVTRFFCEYTTARVLLSDNGSESRNHMLEEICRQFGINHSFIVARHPDSNGLVERINRKILEVLRPVIGEMVGTWEDWLPHVAACINSHVCESTGQSPHYILYGVAKRLPYDLLKSVQGPVYDAEDYPKINLLPLSKVHQQVHARLQQSSAQGAAKQHKRATAVPFRVGDNVMVQLPERQCKLEPKFRGPYTITAHWGGNRSGIFVPEKGLTEVVHSNRLKMTRAEHESYHSASAMEVSARDSPSTSTSPTSPPTHGAI